MLRVFLIYALSGFISLGYQVAWFRIFTDWFGSTNLTFALVVCSFIGGLGLGALLSQRLSAVASRLAHIDDRLRLYGLFEVLISLAALGTLAAALLPGNLWGSFPYHLVDGIWVQDWSYRSGQVLIAALCVFVPCVLMGVTFPLLCHTFVAVPGGARFPAALYAFNTFGACTGVLACQFLFLPWVGHGLTFQVMIGLNLAIGVYFLVMGGATGIAAEAAPTGPAVDVGAASAAIPAKRPKHPRKHKKSTDHPPQPPPRKPALPSATLVLIGALSGLMAGALEGDMFKRISFVLADGVGGLMPAISFWAIVAIFLGSFTVHHLPRIGLNTLRVAVPLAVVAYYLLWRAMYPLSAALDASKDRTPEVQAFTISPLFPASTFELFWFTGLLVFLPFFLVSLLLPWACNQLQAERRHLGLAYGLNTLMFCVGLLSFTLFAPMLSIFYSLKLVFVLLASGVLLLWLLPTSRPPAAWRPALAGAVLLAGVFLVPRDFDPAMMRPDTPPTRYPVEYVMSDGANTTFVVREPGNHRLFFGNLSMSGTNLLAQAYMRLMAHVPLLLQENPERALLICFGVGNTASAIASHPGIRQLDIVDLNRNVFLTAPAFSATHGDVQADPRVRLINDDGRNFLRLTDEVYDLVTSEPPPPMAPGVYRLYSREYYQAIRERLTPSGMMSQWLPVYQMPMEAVALAISTFIDVFPDALLYVGIQNELLLIGGRGEIDLERLARRFGESPAVIADLRSIGVREVEHLLVRIMAGDRELQQRYAGRRVLSDQHNQLDQLMLRPDNLALLPYDPFAVIDYVRGQSPGLAERIAPLVTHLGRLRHRVSSFPVQRVSQDPRIALAGTDWTQLALLQRTAARQQRSGDIRGSIETAREALALAPEYPGLLEWVANGFEQLGMPAESLPYLDRLVAIEPDDPVTRWRLANAFYANAQAAAGVPHLEQALRLAPDWTPALTNLAWLLAVHPDPAVRDPARAEQLSLRIIAQGGEGDVTGRYTLAAAQAAAGRFAEAERTAADALARAEAAGNEALADLLRAQLARYRRGEPATDPRMQRAATD